MPSCLSRSIRAGLMACAVFLLASCGKKSIDTDVQGSSAPASQKPVIAMLPKLMH